jgi:hypothetical protein
MRSLTSAKTLSREALNRSIGAKANRLRAAPWVGENIDNADEAFS